MLGKVVVAFTIVLVIGCTTVKQNEDSNPFGLSIGDSVVIVTKDSARYEFKVTGIDKASISGENIEIPLEDVATARTVQNENARKEQIETIGGAVYGSLYLFILIVPLLLF